MNIFEERENPPYLFILFGIILLVLIMWFTTADSKKHAIEYRAKEAAEEALLKEALVGKTIKSFKWISNTDMEINFTDGTTLQIDATKYRPDMNFTEFHKTP